MFPLGTLWLIEPGSSPLCLASLELFIAMSLSLPKMYKYISTDFPAFALLPCHLPHVQDQGLKEHTGCIHSTSYEAVRYIGLMSRCAPVPAVGCLMTERHDTKYALCGYQQEAPSREGSSIWPENPEVFFLFNHVYI